MFRPLCFALLLHLRLPAVAQADAALDSVNVRQDLVIERIELEGNTRTSEETARKLLRLEPGQPADPERLLESADRLQSSRLFREVAVHTRAGSSPGQVIVVFSVKENRPQIRLGVGYEDMSGWYLIPAELNLDNLSGHGEALRLSARLGYRVGGLVLGFQHPLQPNNETTWGVQLRAETVGRIYFLDETELQQSIHRGSADFRLGRSLTRETTLEGWLSFESVKADSNATVYQNQEVRGRERGDEVPFEELPPQIQSGIDRRDQTRLGVSLTLDSRKGPGLLMHGLWGSLRTESVAAPGSRFASISGDLRGYQPLARGLLAAVRVRGGMISREAPFYERTYLGGLYTVRGYPSQSLSPPEGDLRFATASMELRSAWVGTPENPILVGLAFLDLGVGWSEDAPVLKEGFSGAGYGWRVRVPWVRRIGLDVGFPLSKSPVRDAFHVNVSLGWTY